VTALGQTLARLPIHPRLGRLLVEGLRLGQPERAALAAALLAERDPFLRGPEARPGRRQHASESDVLDRVEAAEDYERSRRTATPLGELHAAGVRFVLRAREQLLRTLRQECGIVAPETTISADEAVLRALLAAYPDRVARRRSADRTRGVMVGGKGVRLAPASGVTESELFLCIDVDAGSSEAWVRQASAVERDWLPRNGVTSAIEVTFDEASERVQARRRVRYEDVLLEESSAALPSAEEVSRVLAEAAQANLAKVLPPDDSAGGLFLWRARCLGLWLPELKLPTFDDESLRELLAWVCAGCKSFDDVRRADWHAALQSLLTPQQRHAVEREAPERLAVPSGSHVTLRYELGRPPVLAVRIQELFGLRDTPRIAGGRVRVLLHLLGPNYRPQQVTDDLASFWANTYPLIRKELRVRYPKHSWPEDPLEATPERRPRRK
jgi:ATP-dependent helicase HrpB